MELPWEGIFSNWPGVSVGHIMRSVPQPPTRPYKMKHVLVLHLLSVLILFDFLRVKDVQELMRITKHGLRMIHSIALALSGLLRHGIGLEELPVEHRSSRKVVADVSTDAQIVSALYSTGHDVRPEWSAEDEAKFFTIPHAEFVWIELLR